MSFGFDIEPVLARLKSQLQGRWLVETSASVEQAFTAVVQGIVPAVYAIPAAETSKPHTGGSGFMSQQTMVAFGTLLCVRNYRAADLGGAALDSLTPCRRAIAAALLNWIPPGCDLVVDHQGGRLEKYTSGNVWWQDIWRTRYRNDTRR